MNDHHGVRRPLAAVAEPSISVAGPGDAEVLSAFLTRLSPASFHQRFLTGPSPTPSRRLLAALLPEPPKGRALLAWLDGELVGHALWVRLGERPAAEIALVVSDQHQRRGIGTALALAVTADLVAHGVEDIEVFSSSGNRAVARMVTRAAPDARRELDGPTTTYTYRAGETGRLSRTA